MALPPTNVATLRARGVDVMDPDEGAMACGEFGPGRLPEPDAILAAIREKLAVPRLLAGKHVLIEAGAVKDIEWSDRHVFLDVSRDRVKSSPPWDPLDAFTQLYAKQLHNHYSWPGSGA